MSGAMPWAEVPSAAMTTEPITKSEPGDEADDQGNDKDAENEGGDEQANTDEQTYCNGFCDGIHVLNFFVVIECFYRKTAGISFYFKSRQLFFEKISGTKKTGAMLCIAPVFFIVMVLPAASLSPPAPMPFFPEFLSFFRGHGQQLFPPGLPPALVLRCMWMETRTKMKPPEENAAQYQQAQRLPVVDPAHMKERGQNMIPQQHHGTAECSGNGQRYGQEKGRPPALSVKIMLIVMHCFCFSS